MAYDEELADCLRALLADEPGVTETKMFGGLAFLVRGNMAVAASGQGGLLVRTDPTTSDDVLATTNARPMEMRGREMPGWLRVDVDDAADDADDVLAEWVGRALAFVQTLPAKTRKR